MGRSQETFNKKEKEKLRLKKRNDKALKKEERKASGSSSLDDMIAYVDENGHISSTPPDLTKKKKIKSEDIQIGIAKREELEPEDLIRKGTVSYYNDSKGFGFIKDHVSQESIFVHANSLVDQIGEGSKVTFETQMGPKGLMAVKVTLTVA